MSSVTLENLKAFQGEVRALKFMNRNSSAYESVRKSLGLPLKNNSNIHIKALLIEVAYACYPENIEADAVLAALGLLKGYNNHRKDLNLEKNIDAAKFLFTERCKKFLKESTYLNIVKVQNVLYHSYEELKNAETNSGYEKKPIETAIGTLQKKIDRCLDEIAKTLYKSNAKELNEYLKASERHIDEKSKKLNRPPLRNAWRASVACSDIKIATKVDIEENETNIEKNTVTAVFTVPDDDDDEENIDVTITFKGRKSKKIKELVDKIVAISFLCIGLIILTYNYIQNYDSFTKIDESGSTLGLGNLIEPDLKPIIERDPDRVDLYNAILNFCIAMILICLMDIVVLFCMIIISIILNQFKKRKK